MAWYQEARKRIEVSMGESVRIIRELQELSQNQLAELTGIPQSTISTIERDRVKGGIERAVVELAEVATPCCQTRIRRPVQGADRPRPGFGSGRS
jgi:DNA-binding XRE family transcriptional regulator